MTERFEMRLDQDILRAIERWRAEQPDVPSRAEAIRRLVESALAGNAAGPLRMSKAESLITMLLCDLIKGLEVDSDIDAEFVSAAVSGGHLWALEWEYPGVFPQRPDDQATVTEVVDILDMWDFIESAYEALGTKEKVQLAKDADPYGKHPQFPGFDGNNESEHISVARFMTRRMDRFSRYKKHELNSHFPVIESYRRMLAVWASTRPKLVGRNLTVDELTELLNARTHPERRGK